jgi:hypothetical protein
MPVVPFAAVVGTTAYIGGPMHGGLEAFSRRYFDGTQVICERSVGGSFRVNYVIVVSTFNLSTLNFVPPFSVH